MTNDLLHPLAADYLQRLRRVGRTLPPARLRELLADIESHLAEAIDPSGSDTQARSVLDRLGEPEAIIAAESPRADELPVRRGAKEWAAIALLLVGGFILVLGWVAGLILLWTSRAWTRRDKWIGTLALPGGLATGLIVGLLAIGEPTKKRCTEFASGVPHCVSVTGHHIPSSALGVVTFVILMLIPIATSIYLARRAT